ncbi:MAG TPA: nucleoside hydrolase [Candidatus Dormibacteraeota bacterium]|nr:nucleoside hydrolase [Candidatus Dormibacteraeota bacterium]
MKKAVRGKRAFYNLMAGVGCFLTTVLPLVAQSRPAPAAAPSQKIKIILDTDIGDDVDDAFALGLALQSPEIEIVGVTTAWGDTALRARMVRRMLLETGRTETPVAEGIVTKSKTTFSQARWAERGPDGKARIDGVEFLLDQLRKNPGEITLVAIGPLTNVGAAIERDAATFRKLKRVVLMGGSVRKGYGDVGYEPDRGPMAEYNIASDIAAAQKLFTSGVPIFMMPLDSTQLKLDEVKREVLFRQGTPLTDILTLLYHESERPTPTLFDAMAVAYVIEPELCPVTNLRIEVDKDGFTREVHGTSNVSVCLESDSEKFFRFAMPRWMKSPGKN